MDPGAVLIRTAVGHGKRWVSCGRFRQALTGWQVTGNRQLEQLRDVFDAAIDSVAAAPAVLRNLPPRPRGRCVVVGAGKAAAPMAAAIDAAWPDVDVSGVVATRYGHAVPAGRIRVLESGHPVPDEASELAAREIRHSVGDLTPDDLVIALISGGGSATMALPVPGLTLRQKQDITRQLLVSGARISDINTVRRHLSGIKGGKLAAAAAPARLLTLIISDVPGDDPAAVASGPTIADDTVPADALDIIERYRIEVPPGVREHLRSKTGFDAGQDASDYRIIASASGMLDAASDKAREMGFNVINLGDTIERESRDLGREIAAMVHDLRAGTPAVSLPAVIVSGGETTVTVDGESGRGGRNTEFLLALAVALEGSPGVFALAADSDGIDGNSDAAGAVITPDTLARAATAGVDPAASLTKHDSYGLFSVLGDLIVTGPTLTNVNDFRIVGVFEAVGI